MYSILYVDDEPGLLEIAKLFLEQTEDFSVDTNISAQKVVDSGTILSYDAIISDYQMPGMDGIGFLKAVRAQFGDIPFILFTGKGREEVVIEAINNGADFYLQKGGDPKAQFAELAHKVRQAVARRQAERSLVESEKRLADIINFLPDATFAIDRLGHVIAWNRAIEEMTGIPSSEMLGKGDFEYAVPFYGTRRKILIDLIFEPDDVIAKNYAHIFHDKDILIADTTLPRPQGRTVTLMGKASPLYNRKGEIIGAIESIRDITGLKLAEEGLSRARKDWETIFRAIGHPALVLDAGNRIIDANDATLAVTGRKLEELKGLRCYEVFHTAGTDHPPDACPFEKLRLTGRTETGETEIEALDRYYAVTCTPVFGPDGQLEKVIHIAMDVTARRKAGDEIRGAYEQIAASEEELRSQYEALAQSEQRIRESEATVMSIFRAAPIGIGVVAGRTIMRVNDRLREMTGYSVEEMQGRDTRFLYPDENEYARVGKIQLNGEMTPGPVTTETRWKCRDGTIRDILLTGIAVDPSNPDAGRVYAALDITDEKEKEKALRQANLVVENSPAVLFRWKAAEGWPVVFVSNNVARFGYAPDELLSGRIPFTAIIYPDDLARVAGEVEKYSREGTDQYRQEYRIIARDGNVFWVDDRTTIERDAEGRITHYQGILIDITDQKESEGLIRESEEKYRKLVEQSRDGIFIAQDSRLVFHNPAFSALTGYSEEELANRSIADIIAPEDRELVLTRHKERTTGKSLPEIYEFSLLRSDGTTRVLVRMSVAPITLDNRPATIGTLHNVTEDRKREEALRESEEKYRALIETTNTGFVILDGKGRVIDANAEYVRLTGHDRLDTIVGRAVLEWTAPYERDRNEEAVRQCIQDGSIWNFEVDYEGPSGTIIPVEINATVLSSGGSLQILTLCRDITRRRMIGEALRESEARLQSILHGSPVLQFVIDSNHRLISWNRAIEEYSGIPAAEVLGTDQQWRAFYPEKRPVLADLLVDGNTDGLYKWYGGKLEKSRYVEGAYEAMDFFPNMGPDGKWLTFTAAPVRDAKGTIIGAIETLEDITDRKKTEDAFLEKTEELDQYFTVSLDLLCIADTDGYFRRLNPEWEKTLGYPLTELNGRKFLDFVHPDDLQETLSVISDLAGQKKVLNFTNRFRHKDGTYRWIEWRSYPKGNLIYAAARDITERKLAEQSLQQSRDSFRSFIDHSYDAVIIHGPDGRVVEVNATMLAMYRLTREEALATTISDLSGPDNSTGDVPWQEVIEGKDQFFPWQARRPKDGSLFDVEVYLTRILIGGRYIILANVRDVTERKRAETALRESEERYKRIFESFVDIYFEIDREGIIRVLSPSVYPLSGWKPEELIGKSATTVYTDPEDRARLLGQLERDKGLHAFEVMFQKRDGAKVPVSINASIRRAPDGKPDGLMGSIHDISESVKARRDLEESERKYRHILENLQDAYFQTDADGTIVMVNPAAVRLYGYGAAEEMIGLPAASLYSEPVKRESMIRKLQDAGRLMDFMGEAKRKDGSTFLASLNIQFLYDNNGQKNGTEATVRDISERRMMERTIQEANRKLNLLNSITRHDVVNQLTVLKGYAQIAAIKKPDPVIADLLLKIDAAADTISRQIDFSKTYQELGVKSPSWFPIEDVVAKAGSGLVRFSNTCRGHEIFADPMLEKVFFNLFDNAARHGEHVTEIVVRCERAPGGLVVIVEDDGLGVPSDLKEKIFEKGFGSNTGYGLFLAREILSLTGITLRETGLFRNGARFEILVPKQSHRFVPPGSRNKREEETI